MKILTYIIKKSILYIPLFLSVLGCYIEKYILSTSYYYDYLMRNLSKLMDV